MSFVAFAATVGGGSALLGGAMIGAGIGGAYSAITGDGDILNSMLTGGLIGGVGAAGLGAMGVGSATTAAGSAPALTASQTAALSSANVAELNALSAKAGLEAGAGSGLMAAPNTITPQIMAASGAGSTAAGLTGSQMLGYGLAGSTALSLLGNKNRSSAGGGSKEDEYDKRLKGYKLSPNYQAYEAPRPNPYYRPAYAAEGGVMNSFDDEAGRDMAGGGMTSLGGYSDGGRMLKGPGDGMSDSIPGVIGGKQPARLADGEFVVPADVVSHLGNGSTDAGAKRLYSMMDNIRKARTGRKKQAPEINVDKYLPVKKASGGIAGYSGGGNATSDDEEKMRKIIMKNLNHSSVENLRMAMDSMDDQKFLMKNMPNYAASMSPPLQGMIEGNQYGDRMGRSYMESAKNNALKNGKNFEEQSSDYAKIIPKINDLQNYGGIASIGKQLDPETRLNLMADIQRSPYDRNTLEAIRRIGGGVSRKLDKDSNLSAYYEQDPMGRSKSGGVRYTQNFAMGGGVNGGAIGYADGGEIASIYESYLGRTPSAAEIKSWQDTGASYDTISKGIRLSPEAAAFSSNAGNAEKIVTTLYKDQVGRAPDAEGLKFWSDALKNGQSVADVTKGINQSIEGQNFDTQYITSLYRQNLARNPEQAGYQYWLSEAQAAGYTPKEIEAMLKQAATPEQAVRNITPGENATQMQLAALESDPYAGRYTTKSIYDLLPDATNVSTIGNQKAQFINPVTQQPYVTNYGEGSWTQKVGTDVLNTPQVDAAIRVARANGTLSTAGYNTLIADLRAATTMDQTRAALAKPQGQVVIDAIYGQQIGENVDLAAAKAEAAKRQAVLNANDKGYYQNNTVLSKLYKDKDITVPFDYSAYNGVDTRTGQADVVTPENFQQKQNDLTRTLSTYKPTYPTLNRNTGLPPSVRDPYSDEGLQFLYGQMMDQYGPPPEGFVNPATFQNTPYTYKPPAPNNLVLNTPILDATKPAPAANTVAAAVTGERAGGLMSINRKKYKRG
jgi:hypothetical protein